MLIACLFNPVCSISLENTISAQSNIQNYDLDADLKIRITGGDWTDESFSSEVGETINFKINVQTETDYEVIAIKIELPESNNKPMFTYTIGSVNPKPSLLNGEGVWLANDTDVVWAWFNTEESWSKEMTFSAKIDKGGSDSIDLKVIASKKNDNNCDEAFDSINCNVEKSKLKSRIKNPFFIFRKYAMLLDESSLFFKLFR